MAVTEWIDVRCKEHPRKALHLCAEETIRTCIPDGRLFYEKELYVLAGEGTLYILKPEDFHRLYEVLA